MLCQTCLQAPESNLGWVKEGAVDTSDAADTGYLFGRLHQWN